MRFDFLVPPLREEDHASVVVVMLLLVLSVLALLLFVSDEHEEGVSCWVLLAVAATVQVDTVVFVAPDSFELMESTRSSSCLLLMIFWRIQRQALQVNERDESATVETRRPSVVGASL